MKVQGYFAAIELVGQNIHISREVAFGSPDTTIIPVQQVTSVQINPPRLLSMGSIQFTYAGSQTRGPVAGALLGPTEDTVEFGRGDLANFEALARAIAGHASLS